MAKKTKPPFLPIPGPEGGYEWLERLYGGWYSVPAWGKDGWDLGAWPLVIVVHWDSPDDDLFAEAVYVESDIAIRTFATREERDKATDETAVYYWKYFGVFGAPRYLTDSRLGPYVR